MFFLDDQFNRRRVSDIKVISRGRAEERAEGRRWVHDVEMTDGTKIVILDVTLSQIGKTPAHVLPSTADLCIWTEDADGGADFLNPVVGWAITYDGNIAPVTAGGSVNDLDDQAIVIASDGHVWQNGFVQAENLAAFRVLGKDGD